MNNRGGSRGGDGHTTTNLSSMASIMCDSTMSLSENTIGASMLSLNSIGSNTLTERNKYEFDSKGEVYFDFFNFVSFAKFLLISSCTLFQQRLNK